MQKIQTNYIQGNTAAKIQKHSDSTAIAQYQLQTRIHLVRVETFPEFKRYSIELLISCTLILETFQAFGNERTI